MIFVALAGLWSAAVAVRPTDPYSDFFSSCFILPLRHLGPNMLIASVYSLVDLGHSVMGAKAAVWQTGSFQGLYFLLSSTLGAHD